MSLKLILYRKTKNGWFYNTRKIFCSRSPIESWHINERGLLDNQSANFIGDYVVFGNKSTKR